ncbi:MAG: alpha amylase C-terminal domain-containing protein, partial [Ignavibacteriales bacterium]|nr:alpha amylase C-terminal domain-containing protein [Ignavibacteriales bacterium]
YRVGVPEAGDYDEVLNSDSSYYGGSNMGNTGTIPSDPVGHHGRSHSLNLTLPPLSVLFLKRKQS